MEQDRLTPDTPVSSQEPGRAWVELDQDALVHNVHALSALLPEGCRLMAVVKANAYGHGDLAVARCCARAGVSAFGVATVEEGARLRQGGIEGEILVLGWSGPQAVPLLSRLGLSQAVVSLEHARALSQQGLPLQVHLKVDTGMCRLGVPWQDAGALHSLFSLPNLTVRGMFSHLSDAGIWRGAGADRTPIQVDRFFQAVASVAGAGLPPGRLHLQNSLGLLNGSGLPACGYARVGIALYGVHSAPGTVTRACVSLRPALSLRARIAQIHTLEPGQRAGYDGTFLARRPTRLATVTIGYADGYPRSLSNGAGRVLIHGLAAPVAGLICMDQLLADVTDIPHAAPGSTATLIGRDGDAYLPAEEVAAAAGSITNELLSRLGPRLERVLLPKSPAPPS